MQIYQKFVFIHPPPPPPISTIVFTATMNRQNNILPSKQNQATES